MMSERNELDLAVVLGAILVFTLPLTLLIPDFSVWEVVPKLRIERFHFIEQELTWPQINVAIISLLTLFFCLYLEIRKRKLDDIVANVLSVTQATEATMQVERGRQEAAVRACVQLLDASADHYENLVLLRDDLRQRNRIKQYPPVIELSSCPL